VREALGELWLAPHSTQVGGRRLSGVGHLHTAYQARLNDTHLFSRVSWTGVAALLGRPLVLHAGSERILYLAACKQACCLFAC